MTNYKISFRFFPFPLKAEGSTFTKVMGKVVGEKRLQHIFSFKGVGSIDTT